LALRLSFAIGPVVSVERLIAVTLSTVASRTVDILHEIVGLFSFIPHLHRVIRVLREARALAVESEMSRTLAVRREERSLSVESESRLIVVPRGAPSQEVE
jgi:hypothetical protein